MQPKDILERDLRAALKTAPSAAEAARVLGISRPSLYRLMKRFGVEVRRIVA